MGPLVFCGIMVQPLLLSLASELTLQYLNDFTLGGDVATDYCYPGCEQDRGARL